MRYPLAEGLWKIDLTGKKEQGSADLLFRSAVLPYARIRRQADARETVGSEKPAGGAYVPTVFVRMYAPLVTHHIMSEQARRCRRLIPGSPGSPESRYFGSGPGGCGLAASKVIWLGSVGTARDRHPFGRAR